MQVKVSSGQYEIIAGGMAYLFDNDLDLTIEVKADNGYCIWVVLNFRENATGKKEIQSEIHDTKIILNCYNFDDSGAGLSVPVQLAVIEGKGLYLTFWSYLDGVEPGKKQVRSVRYSLFYEKEPSGDADNEK